ncbi:MAG: winged helix-turn-helix domain-containing protein [Tetrasphaera sp.]
MTRAESVGPEPKRALTDPEARALASSVRWRIIYLCDHEPLTNRAIAEALEMPPATTLHHVRTLRDTGFLEALPARRGNRGAKEIPYRTTDKLTNTNVGDVTDPVIGAFTTAFGQAPLSERTLLHGTLMLTAEEMSELTHRIDDLVLEYDNRPRQPESREWGILVASHPARHVARRQS